MRRKKILIADDDKDLVRSLTARCKGLGLEVVTAHDSFCALTAAHTLRPDLIVLDVNMPSGNGLSVCEMLAGEDGLDPAPVVMLTADENDDTVRRCHQLCAYYVLKCPNLWRRLEPLILELLKLDGCRADTSDFAAADKVADVSRQTEALACSNQQLIDVVFEMLATDPLYLNDDDPHAKQSRPWVLCIDDDPDYSRAMKLRLETRGIDVVRAYEGMAGLRRAFTGPADVILLDYEMPNGQGDYILGRLKDNPVTQDIPVIVITGRKDASIKRKMLNLGADCFMTKPVEFSSLLGELRRHIEILQEPAPQAC